MTSDGPVWAQKNHEQYQIAVSDLYLAQYPSQLRKMQYAHMIAKIIRTIFMSGNLFGFSTVSERCPILRVQN